MLMIKLSLLAIFWAQMFPGTIWTLVPTIGTAVIPWLAAETEAPETTG